MAPSEKGMDMIEFLPKEVQEGLDRARKAARKLSSRLSIHDGDQVYKVLHAWEGGFALDAETTPQLRGLVDLYDGPRHLSQCLIMATSEEEGELRFEYKRLTEASGEQPVDFYRAVEAPAGLLPHSA